MQIQQQEEIQIFKSLLAATAALSLSISAQCAKFVRNFGDSFELRCQKGRDRKTIIKDKQNYFFFRLPLFETWKDFSLLQEKEFKESNKRITTESWDNSIIDLQWNPLHFFLNSSFIFSFPFQDAFFVLKKNENQALLVLSSLVLLLGLLLLLTIKLNHSSPISHRIKKRRTKAAASWGGDE